MGGTLKTAGDAVSTAGSAAGGTVKTGASAVEGVADTTVNAADTVGTGVREGAKKTSEAVKPAKR